jgi:hypothetical protein
MTEVLRKMQEESSQTEERDQEEDSWEAVKWMEYRVFSVGRGALLAKTQRETWASPQTFGSLKFATIGVDVRKIVRADLLWDEHR